MSFEQSDSPRTRLTLPQSRALLAFDGPEPTDPTNEMIVGHNGVGNVRMVMTNLCEKGLCIRREHLNDCEGYRYELTMEGSEWCKALRAPRRYVVETNAHV